MHLFVNMNEKKQMHDYFASQIVLDVINQQPNLEKISRYLFSYQERMMDTLITENIRRN